MTTTFALLLATTLAGQGGDIAQGIVDNGHKRVAVLPVVLCRYSGEQSTVGSLGPRGKSLSNALYDQLVATSLEGALEPRLAEDEVDAPPSIPAQDDMREPEGIVEHPIGVASFVRHRVWRLARDAGREEFPSFPINA